MDLPTGLASYLRQLAAGLDPHDSSPLDGALTELEHGLRAAVSSYRGMRLTLVPNGWPITLASFTADAGGTIATSLRIPMSLILRDDTDGRVTFYAGTPGAFVDLGADLGYSLHTTDIVLDADLDHGHGVSGLFGLDGLRAINRAVGMLIEQGEDPLEAHAVLRRRARAAGQTTDQYAETLLAR